MLTNDSNYADAQKALFDRALVEILNEDRLGSQIIWKAAWNFDPPRAGNFDFRNLTLGREVVPTDLFFSLLLLTIWILILLLQ